MCEETRCEISGTFLILNHINKIWKIEKISEYIWTAFEKIKSANLNDEKIQQKK